jgi:ATP-dependent exoDNAse (exonuclease V) beta subunit
MKQTNSHTLTVYKASAGSGKTFTLALEYVKLLIQNPDNYQYILAVTFTNKATDEMKRRILSQLYGVAKRLDSSSTFFDKLQEAFPELPSDEIAKRAQLSLQNILAHYNWFRVVTIDSFFQSVLRNLAMELHLNANLSVGLNDKEVEEQAVDNMIEGIEKENDPVLTWILDFIDQQMRENKSWNVIDKIKSFSLNLSQEIYKENAEQLIPFQDNPRFANDYKKKLRATIIDADKQMKDIADRFFQFKDDRQLADNYFFQGKKGIVGYFAKLKDGHDSWAKAKTFGQYVSKAYDDGEEMLKKADRDTAEGQSVIHAVHPLLVEAEDTRRRLSRVVNTAVLTMSNLNELRLLGRIGQEVSLINAENNSYLLSSTQKLLNDMIDDSDAPFIYEKIGGAIKFIMIDEFQDTSVVQWQNFKVLLNDCISHHSGSLIVGDVKQSIYRWRSGDWTILQNLTPKNDPRIEAVSLQCNYRSEYNIIAFNNVFFEAAATITHDNALEEIPANDRNDQEILTLIGDVSNAYSDVVQQPRESKKQDPHGYVQVRLLDDSSDDAMIEEVKNTLITLFEKGIPSNKIAVLVRKNKEIQGLAQYFQQNAIVVDGKETMVNMVSDEAFRLDASSVVCTIISAMRLLANPSDALSKAALEKTYSLSRLDDEPLPADFMVHQDQYLSLSLVEMAEKLYSTFHLEHFEGQSAYVCAFFDSVSKYSQDHVADLKDFLDEWDKHICGKSIHSENVDGVRMMTLHKAKGLQFENVIMPYCDWGIESKDDLLWVKTRKPFDDVPIVPVSFSTEKLLNSDYEKEYVKEHIMNLVDNLNLMYVGFTRAKSNLFVFARSNKKTYPTMLLSSVLEQLKDEHPDIDCIKDDDEGTVTYSFGDIFINEERQEESDSPNVFEPREDTVHVEFTANNYRPVFLQSNDSAAFITPEEDEKKKLQIEYIRTGNVLHGLLANIKYKGDVERAISQLDFNGYLYGKQLSREELLKYIHELLDNPQVSNWFDPHWQVINERSILTAGHGSQGVTTYRPDRVITDGKQTIVIDFKTGEPKKSHHDQVRNYVYLLRQMGYAQVEGYLWYIRTNDIQLVEPCVRQ